MPRFELEESVAAQSLRIAEQTAYMIVQDYPEIADAFRRGMTLREITSTYFPDESNRSQSIMLRAVHLAIQQLIPPDEYKKLCDEHRIAYHYHLSDSHALHTPEMVEARAAGRQAWLDGLSTDQREEYAIRRVIGSGHTPWSKDEIDYLHACAGDQRYSTGKGYPDYRRIADALNNRFGNNRTHISVKSQFHHTTGTRNGSTPQM